MDKPMNKSISLCALPAVLFLLVAVSAAETEQRRGSAAPQPAAPPEAVARWQDMKFGLFLTWGPVSLKGKELGHSRGREIPIEEYDELYKQFNPTEFDAEAIVKLARESGVKYIVFVTRHHDGFCMFDTKLTDYNIMRTPFGRDIVGELAAACREQGVALGLYDSVCDWWHPDFPLGSPKGFTRKPNPDFDRYERYFTDQVEELMTKYGPLLTLWFDWPQEFGLDRGLRVLHKVRKLQPDILINDRLAAPLGTAIPGDYDTPEQKVGNSQFDRPWETCMTLGTQWAWKPDDRIKSLEECLHVLINAVGGGGNLLLNTGPMPDGRIEPRQADRLREIGDWLAQYGKSIYDTRGGPFERGQWGAATYKGDTIFLHVLDPNLDEVKLAPLSRKVIESRVLTGGTATVKSDDVALRISIPKADRHEIDTIVALKLGGPAVDAVEKPWNLEELSKPSRTFAAPEHESDGVKAVFFEALPWRGKPTRAFAYYALPKVEPGKKVPAMVLVHGGGGSAYLPWVKIWRDRGYAAISMDTCGNVPGSRWNNFTRHEWAGPPGWGGFDQTDLPLRDQWTRHAVADVILAHSLIRSLPQVDAERVGVTGASWGGYLVSIAAGVDRRFRFVAPVYGCGFIGSNSVWLKDFQNMGPTKAGYWLGLWDPSVYLRDAKMPMLWVSGTNDFAYPMDSLQESYRLPRGDRAVSLRVRMPHTQEAAMNAPEIHAFADSLFRGGEPLPKVSIRRREGMKVGVNFQSKTPVKKVELNYTTDAGPWAKRRWETIEAEMDLAAGMATGTLPEGTAAYFFNVIDSRGLVVSTDHFNVPRH